MEIFTLLETLEEMLEGSKSIPFSNKGIVDKEEMLEIIKEIRLKLPEELKQAKWVKEERQRILVEAQKEAFQKTLSAVLSLLSDEAKTYIQTAYGDLNTYLTTQIEAVVNEKRA